MSRSFSKSVYFGRKVGKWTDRLIYKYTEISHLGLRDANMYPVADQPTEDFDSCSHGEQNRSSENRQTARYSSYDSFSDKASQQID